MHNVIISGHQLDLTEGIKQHTTAKVLHVLRHATEAIRVDVTVSPEGHSPVKYNAKGHIVIWGPDMYVTAQSEDLYKSLDIMAAMLDRMVRRKHRKLKTKRHR